MNLQAPKYGWARVLIIIIPYILFVGIFEFAGIYVTKFTFAYFDGEVQRAYQEAVQHFFSCAGTLLFLWGAMRILDGKPFRDLGFCLKKRSKDIAIGVFAGLGIMGIGYGILALTNEVEFWEYNFNLPNLFFSVVLFVCVAILEETLTRGYILRNLMQSMNKYVALVLTSLLFATMHGLNPNMSWFNWFSLFLAGLALGITYIYTKNLWFPITYHFSWNFFQSLFGFNVSGQDFYSWVNFSIPTPNFLNGGAFGFEGSYLSLIADGLVVIIAIFIYQRKQLK
ncbi:MAG: CPBP family intramembrane metalloprotease [Flavobacteriaceae bacterium]|nr:CPBP family intramembrane metalloprotease [Flavobacteriaceae bacterium]